MFVGSDSLAPINNLISGASTSEGSMVVRCDKPREVQEVERKEARSQAEFSAPLLALR